MMPTIDAKLETLRNIPAAPLSDPALRVLEARYLHRNSDGKPAETPRQMFARVAWAVAAAETKFSRQLEASKRNARVDDYGRLFFELMVSLKFLPNSPTLMNAGRSRGQLSACFVLPVDDDLGSVFETLREAAIVQKSGGGTGFSFGQLRPAGDLVRSSGGKACGPMGALRLYDSATELVKQGGTRRGANMAILPVDHPDIESFIKAKLDGGIKNFNLSVGVSDVFMKAVRQGSTWNLRNPRTREVTRALPARRLWRLIAECAWACGDPGVVFLDRINEVNPTPELGPMESTNPCGEQPLLAYESCNLGSMNLLAYVDGEDLAWRELERDIRLAVRFLDNVIEANHYPLLAIEEITLMNRKIGLGIMGWADALMQWGVPYDSEEAVRRAEKTMKRFSKIAISASEDLAKERGAFSKFEKSRWAKNAQKPRRNSTVTTIAPTGTISIIAGVSSGIEPVFSLAYERRALDGEKFVFVHPAVGTALSSKRDIEKIVRTGSAAAVKSLPAGQRRILRTAAEIDPKWHVKMQAAFQKHTENGVSKTINLPESATARQIQKIYEIAYELGCKGITVYRDKSKQVQVLSSGVKRRLPKLL